MTDFKCTFETKKGTEVEFTFNGIDYTHARFYILDRYPGAKKIHVKEI